MISPRADGVALGRTDADSSLDAEAGTCVLIARAAHKHEEESSMQAHKLTVIAFSLGAALRAVQCCGRVMSLSRLSIPARAAR